MKLASVIIPMYNSEKFIKKTLELVSKQTYTNFEVIVIDDCSSDKCYEICNNFIKKDSRFHLYRNEVNKGICETRNYGINIANGEYIIFCDDDDEIVPSLLQDNITLLEEKNASFVKFGRELIDIDKNNKIVSYKTSNIPNELVYEDKELFDNFFEIKKTGVLINVWNGIYRKEIIKNNNLFFDTNMKYGSEDAKFSLEYLLVSAKLVINPQNYYIHYRRVNSSTSKQFNINKINSLVETSRIESIIWKKINNNTEIICSKNAYIINIIIIQLLNDQCPYSTKEKIDIIRKVNEEPHLQYSINYSTLIKICKYSRKQFIFTVLNKCKLYRLILLLISKGV